MNQPREEWQLPVHRLGRRVLVYDRLDSTNNKAAELAADPANDGVVVLADEQTAGRGQHGRTWLAPPRASVLLSVLFFPPPVLQRASILTAWAAVGVCTTLARAFGLAPRIKWPNDVLLRGRKVCGILIEQGRGIVAGLGLNVQQSEEDLARAGLPEATSLAAQGLDGLETSAVARCLIRQLDEDLDHLLQGNKDILEASWREHLALLGRTVVAECADGQHQGQLRELGLEGVLLRQADGSLLRLEPERIQHLSPAP
jgi:BirA family biotin operon repressor/biotin-[acetyl-CoA-carboxylase] ligase